VAVADGDARNATVLFGKAARRALGRAGSLPLTVELSTIDPRGTAVRLARTVTLRP
jgi:hypothetical protein